jgi:predicted amidophosphoribosyltransferase
LKTSVITWIPTSKAPQDPEYDNRLEIVAQGLAKDVDGCHSIELIRQIESTEAFHKGGHRDPRSIQSKYRIIAEQLPMACRSILVIDDVLTTGAHYRAFADKIHSKWGKHRLIGVFVARAIERDPGSVFQDLG